MSDIEKFQAIQIEGLEIFKKKNTDYGKSYANFGLIGILVRIQDKMNRLINISETNILLVKDETLRDTLLDLQNYSTLALMLYDK